jgi:phage FluMu gp28-like protein
MAKAKAAPQSEAARAGAAVVRAYRSILLPYQWRWLADRSRYKIGCWSRQGGKSFTIALETVLGAGFEGLNQYILAASQRQSIETLGQAAKHCAAIQLLLDSEYRKIGRTAPRLLDGDPGKLEIRFANGAVIQALPNNPETIRGPHGEVTWDEASVTAQDKAVFQAIFAVATRNGYRVRIVSTPFGDQGVFHAKWTDDTGRWSKHSVPVDLAIREGLKIDLPALVEAIGDQDAIDQEYYCRFLSDAQAYYPSDLLRASLWDETQAARVASGESFLGVDIGRKKDRTAIYRVTKSPTGHLYLWPGDTLDRVPFDEQLVRIGGSIKRVQARRLCIDSTGMGSPIAESLQRSHPGIVEAVTFTASVKEDLAVTVRKLLEQGKLHFPEGDRRLLVAAQSIRRFVTTSANVRFDAEQNAAGHADEFWAAALAVHAAVNERVATAYQVPVHHRFGRVI